jgi:hypothetical protein
MAVDVLRAAGLGCLWGCVVLLMTVDATAGFGVGVVLWLVAFAALAAVVVLSGQGDRP